MYYNGSINRELYWRLKDLCAKHAKGKVKLQDELERMMNYRKGMTSFQKEYLIKEVAVFIGKKGVWPNKIQMRDLQKAAEQNRVAKLSWRDVKRDLRSIVFPGRITSQDVMLEILQLSEQIFETRRENKPKDIRSSVSNYPESLSIENDDFGAFIDWHRDSAGVGKDPGTCDYVLIAALSNGDHFVFKQDTMQSGVDCVANEELLENADFQSTAMRTRLLTIHQALFRMAKQEGVIFESEIAPQNYDRFLSGTSAAKKIPIVGELKYGL